MSDAVSKKQIEQIPFIPAQKQVPLKLTSKYLAMQWLAPKVLWKITKEMPWRS